jgi:4-amino-4-deoxy-L-arabinose transferase-like glycosyltransferase
VTRRAFWIGLTVISITAVFLRMGVGLQLQHTPKMANPPIGSDMQTYWDLAQRIEQGHWPASFYNQPFYYAVFLPVVIVLLGTSPIGLACVQACLGGAAVLLTGWSAACAFGRRAGLLAAACLAAARFHIFVGQFALSDALGTFWVAAIIAMAFRTIEKSTWLRWMVLGVMCGAAASTRGNIIVLVPGLIALLMWRHWTARARLAACVALFVASVFAAELPFSVPNWRTAGHWTGPATSGEITLALGNTPETAPGTLAYPPTFSAWEMAARRPGHDRVPVLRSIFGWIAREPLAWIELKVRMALLFWSPPDVPNNLDIGVDGLPESSLLRQRFIVGTGLLLALGLTGTILSIWNFETRRDTRVAFLLYALAALFGSTIILFIVGRFRLTIFPLVCMFAGYALSTVVAHLSFDRGNSRASPRYRTIVALLIAVPFVWKGFAFYQTHVERGVIRVVRPHGVLAIMGDERLVYDHGPEPLGGWSDVSLPVGLATTLTKTFSIPSVPDVSGLVPVRIRLPLRFRTGSAAEIEIHDRGRSFGAMHVTGASTDAISWVDVDFPVNAMASERSAELTLDIVIRPDAGSSIDTVIDRRRNYGRTRWTVPGAAPAVSQSEACVELVLGRTAPSRIAL